MNTDLTATCSRCERRRTRRIKPGRALDLILIVVLGIDIYATWGRPAPAPAAPASPCQGTR